MAIVPLLIVGVVGISLFWHLAPAHALGQGTLVDYWPLNESSGTSATDVSGNGNTGTYDGSPTPSTDVPTTSFPDSHSLDFAGNSSVSTPLSINNSSAFTISAWVNLANMNGTQSLFGQNGVVEAYVNGPMIGCTSPKTGNAIGGVDSTEFTNAWHLITCTGDSSGMRFYLGGTLIGVTYGPGGDYGSSASTFNIGGYVTDPSTPDYFSGKIDDVRVYNRALSATEVSQLGQGDNTTATWTGSMSTDYNTPTNWDIGAVPDGFTNIVVPETSNAPQFSTDTALANLSLTQTNSVLSLNGHNLTFNDGGTFSNQGILQLNGTETLTNFTNDTDSGIVSYAGGVAATYSSLPTGYDYAGLTLNNGSVWNLPQNLTAAWLKNYDTFNTNSHPVTLAGTGFVGGLQNLGTFNAGTSAISSSGLWWNQGTFNAGTSTVTLDGTNQFVIGDSTFYNLKKTVTLADTLTFVSGSTQTIANTLSLSGVSGQLLSLASMTPGTQWNVNPDGVANLSYLSISDSKNTSTVNTPLKPTTSANGGNNTAWDIVAPSVTNLGPSNYVGGSPSGNTTPTISFTTADSDTDATVTYRLQISSTSNFSPSLIDYSTTIKATPGVVNFKVGQTTAPGAIYGAGGPGQTLPSGSYYWRVFAIDNGGLRSSTIVANNGNPAFTIDTTAPVPPTQLPTVDPGTESPTNTQSNAPLKSTYQPTYVAETESLTNSDPSSSSRSSDPSSTSSSLNSSDSSEPAPTTPSYTYTWWWLIVIILIAGLFWWFIVAWKRHRKDDD